jgi:hypothetical protein
LPLGDDLIADAAMRIRRTRLEPWSFPWIQAFPGAHWPQHFRTGSSYPHGRIGLGRRSGFSAIRQSGGLDSSRETSPRGGDNLAVLRLHQLPLGFEQR